MKTRLILTVTAAALLGVVTTTGTAGASQLCALTPVGTWSGTVTRPGASDPIQLSFGKSGHACLITTSGSGTATSSGTWTRSGSQQFNYKIKESLTDANGTATGWIQINQDAVQEGTDFSSSGTSLIYDLNGNLQGSVISHVTATRTSSSALPCAA
ncbi:MULTISPECIES: hypothetical protein [unclassified Streptomyces]|uniref:hypothetical protein n=1 Tax=unclassified Streptomyces TaxID=2593676 RepID=UPI00225B2132|nr:MULTISPECIES: hypothetical protein [unclassified Streptomyces]MCX5440581.1 hypothetical protein [Streptomyces sp. NBC_00063]WSE18066.1 hypothetical protein OG518_34590 [Streptomyces sp. NBC_01397]WUB93041.1 hypothetical protein OHO83_12465 [Streptomyces sp. NBC_00569]